MYKILSLASSAAPQAGQGWLHWNTQGCCHFYVPEGAAAPSPPELAQGHALPSFQSASLVPLLSLPQSCSCGDEVGVEVPAPDFTLEATYQVRHAHLGCVAVSCAICWLALTQLLGGAFAGVTGWCQSSLQNKVVDFAPWQVAEVMQETWQQQC